jgi:hypothetical protein
METNDRPFRLLTEAEVADLIGMSRSWIRTERSKMKRGLPHCFKVAPAIILGHSYYLDVNIADWLNNLRNSR